MGIDCPTSLFIPFRINEIALATSPIKLFEYMSAGKPIVTTKLPECCKHERVLTAEDAGEFAERLAEALRLKDDPEYRQALVAQGRAHSWAARFATLDERLVSLRGRPAGVTPGPPNGVSDEQA